MRRCSGLVNHKARTATFITLCCSQAEQIRQNVNTSAPSTQDATSVTPTGIYDDRVQQSVSASQRTAANNCQQSFYNYTSDRQIM